MINKCLATGFVACLSAVLVSGPAVSQETQKDRAKASVTEAQAEVKTIHQSQRVSKLMGMDIQNAKGENLGEIKDLVIDLRTGKVRYATLSFGGFLGVGDKLFAVPLSALKIKHEGDDAYFVLNVDKQRLKNAPGFNESAWPDFGNAQWMAEVDTFYGADSSTSEYASGGKSHSGKFVSADGDKLVMVDASGKNQHSHFIGPDVRITVDGKVAKLSDLKKDQHLVVKTEDRDGKMHVTSIEAHSRR